MTKIQRIGVVLMALAIFAMLARIYNAASQSSVDSIVICVIVLAIGGTYYIKGEK